MQLVRRWSSAQTPALRQWAALKAQAPQHLLFFRVGDFYECLHDDARLASSVLNIALTSRRSGGGRIPMAGVPHHAAPSYLARLKAAGITVAVADQTESPEEARAAGRRIVSRKITRIITPATCVDEELLEVEQAVHLAAVAFNAHTDTYHVVWSDVASGNGGEKGDIATREALVDLLSSLNIKELLLVGHDFPGSLPISCRTVPLPDESSCHSAIRQYLKETLQEQSIESVSLPAERSFSYLSADAGTRQALDLFSSGSSRGSTGSLLHVFTSAGHRYQMGSLRLLRQRLANPLHPSERDEIESRLSGVKMLMENAALLRELKTSLSQANMYGDAERALQRIALAVHRTPLHLARDLRSVALAIQLAESLSVLNLEQGNRWHDLQLAKGQLREVCAEILNLVGLEDGDEGSVNLYGVVRGADSVLDNLLDPAVPKAEILEFENGLSQLLAVPVKISRGRGPDDIHFSVSDKHSELVSRLSREQHDIRYVGQRANTTRWKTLALEKLGRRLARRESEALKRSEKLLHSCRSKLVAVVADSKRILNAIYDVDVTVGVATSARIGLNVPDIVDSGSDGGHVMKMKGLFHPVMKLALADEEITTNDFLLGSNFRIAVVTGPNMSGKSSLLRATAIASWLTQCGFPAPVLPGSTMSLFESIFVRVGSSDDISHDKSSFMMEMSGVAAITRRNASMLVCLDELGRSTAPDDGAAICAALIRYLAERRNVLSVLSTHFRLEKYRQELPDIMNIVHLEVLTEGDRHVFTHRLREGAAGASLAFHVARIAGCPENLIQDAERLRDLD